ncbi:MAG: hypothetical protein AAF468_00715 [Pseudomonadota bacterium]
MRALFLSLTLAIASVGFASAQEQTTSDGRPPIICNQGALTTGLLCEGDFCDDISMRCTSFSREVRRTYWTNFVKTRFGTTAFCSMRGSENRGFMSGIACEGDWCDNVALQCTELQLFEPDFRRCVWSRSFSDEDDWQSWVSPFYYVVALDCSSDRHCDNKRVRMCRIKRRSR